MRNYYTISTLHFIDGGDEFAEDDIAKVTTNDGQLFKGQIVNIKNDSITLAFDSIDGEITIPYKEIDDIEKAI
jgi:ribosome maturation factor RimP